MLLFISVRYENNSVMIGLEALATYRSVKNVVKQNIKTGSFIARCLKLTK